MWTVKNKLCEATVSLLCLGMWVGACATFDDSVDESLMMNPGARSGGSSGQSVVSGERSGSTTGESSGNSGESGSSGASGNTGSSGSSGASGSTGKSGSSGASGSTGSSGSSGASGSTGKSGSSGASGKADSGGGSSAGSTLTWPAVGTTSSLDLTAGEHEVVLDFADMRPGATPKFVISPTPPVPMGSPNGVTYTLTIDGAAAQTKTTHYDAVSVSPPSDGGTVTIKITVDIPATVKFGEG